MSYWRGYILQEGVDDLVLCSSPSNQEITSQLSARFGKEQIYTNIGDVLISVRLKIRRAAQPARLRFAVAVNAVFHPALFKRFQQKSALNLIF